jgi:hypothetical protein
MLEIASRNSNHIPDATYAWVSKWSCAVVSQLLDFHHPR